MTILASVLLIICIILWVRMRHIQNTLDEKCNSYAEKNSVLEAEKKSLQDVIEQKKASHQSYKEKEMNIENDLLSNPSAYYKLKHSCMTYDEAGVFYYINRALDELIPDKGERQNYYVFPQFALHSIIKLDSRLNKKSLEHDISTRNFVAKSIDFIICRHCASCNGKTNYIDHTYVPVLAFELDGPSHHSDETYGKKDFERTQKSDEFKNIVFQSQNIPLIRYTPIYIDIKLNPGKYDDSKPKPTKICPEDSVQITQMLKAVIVKKNG